MEFCRLMKSGWRPGTAEHIVQYILRSSANFGWGRTSALSPTTSPSFVSNHPLLSWTRFILMSLPAGGSSRFKVGTPFRSYQSTLLELRILLRYQLETLTEAGYFLWPRSQRDLCCSRSIFSIREASLFFETVFLGRNHFSYRWVKFEDLPVSSMNCCIMP